MYSVVGCRECGAFWIVADRPETTGCPRCGMRHPFDRLKKFVTTEDADHAREVRSRLLAEQSGYGEAYERVEPFGELGDQVDRDDSDFVGANLLEETAEDSNSGDGQTE